jgi:hypothetical protein
VKAKKPTQKRKRREYAPGTQAIAVGDSDNSKIGKAATTYAAQDSCPTSCPFFDGGGCYAEQGTVGMFVTAPLNAAAKLSQVPPTPESVAQWEANAIDGLKVKAGRPLRIHTVGDCKTAPAAELVAGAAERYVAREGGPAWTYTHAWRVVPREAWGDVNVLASCETAAEVKAAHKRGYATALVVDEFPSHRRFDKDGASVVPCPAQTKEDVDCAKCRLCMNAERLHKTETTIGFAVHGTALTQKRALLALNDPDNPDRRLSTRVLIPRFIIRFRAENGREPTNREIADGLNVSPSSVAQMRKKLKTGKRRPPK